MSFKHAMHKIPEKTTIKGIIQRFKKRKTGLSFNTDSVILICLTRVFNLFSVIYGCVQSGYSLILPF